MGWRSNDCDISVLVGKTITNVYEGSDNAEIIFECTDGTSYKTYHMQDCCESVWFEDSDNALSCLVGETVTSAYSTSQDMPEESESGTWTFYTVASRNVSVTMRFCGESNDYYSESVDFCKIG